MDSRVPVLSMTIGLSRSMLRNTYNSGITAKKKAVVGLFQFHIAGNPRKNTGHKAV